MLQVIWNVFTWCADHGFEAPFYCNFRHIEGANNVQLVPQIDVLW